MSTRRWSFGSALFGRTSDRSIMVWSFFSWAGVGNLAQVNSIVTADGYIDIFTGTWKNPCWKWDWRITTPSSKIMTRSILQRKQQHSPVGPDQTNMVCRHPKAQTWIEYWEFMGDFGQQGAQNWRYEIFSCVEEGLGRAEPPTPPEPCGKYPKALSVGYRGQRGSYWLLIICFYYFKKSFFFFSCHTLKVPI